MIPVKYEVHQDAIDSLVKRSPAMKPYIDAATRLGKIRIIAESRLTAEVT